MRLINTNTKELKEFFDGATPPYAILSHRWEEEEVTLQEFQAVFEHQLGPAAHPEESKKGLRKIDGCCELARRNGCKWIWVDTCCIDKTSSAELSEAINSMFRWYQEARVCYVYLSDVSSVEDMHSSESQFRSSRWFTRGWTLQELVAPKSVEFYDAAWVHLGSRSGLQDSIQEITGIPSKFFLKSVHDASIAQRMSWAAKRQTTRREDLAYCLLGIFSVNMPLLYGEGDRAFRRLQEEIIKQSDDQTIFAWGFKGNISGINHHEVESDEDNDELAILARHPSDFSGCGDVITAQTWYTQDISSFEKVKTGLRIELPLIALPSTWRIWSATFRVYGVLSCHLAHNYEESIAIPFHYTSSKGILFSWFFATGENMYVVRRRHDRPILYNYVLGRAQASKPRTIVIDERPLYSGDKEKTTIIKEAGDLSHVSWTLDSALEAERGQDYTLIRGMAMKGSTAFIHYCTRMRPGEKEEFFTVKAEHSKRRLLRAELDCSATAHDAGTDPRLLSVEDLKRLHWRHQRARNKFTSLTISSRFHSRSLSGDSMNVVTVFFTAHSATITNREEFGKPFRLWIALRLSAIITTMGVSNFNVLMAYLSIIILFVAFIFSFFKNHQNDALNFLMLAVAFPISSSISSRWSPPTLALFWIVILILFCITSSLWVQETAS